MIRRLNRKTVAAVVVTAALLGGGVAAAYPPGTELEVSATAQATPDGKASVTVTVANADPRCSIRIRVEGADDVVLPPGTFTTTVIADVGPGRRRVAARTIDCEDNEHDKDQFVILDAKASGAPTSPVGSSYRVEITGVEPGVTVTSTATLQGSNPLVQRVKSDVADKRGEATNKFKFNREGTWVITTVVNPPGTTINPVCRPSRYSTPRSVSATPCSSARRTACPPHSGTGARTHSSSA